ncbi:MAG: proline dehydrogenase family protein [Tannerellaceae bacterium]|jgi:proline dehydrogenase|nr:proline dehydrogenase family protein [Tannerellaceae bacterium]
MPDFNNTEIAFASKSDGELRNALMLFNVLKHPLTVKAGKLASLAALKIRFPLGWIVKPTLYRQFIGGETLDECRKHVEALYRIGVESTLDYSAESEQTPQGIESTYAETLRSIDFAAANEGIAYAVFKPSTLVTDNVLSKASEKKAELSIEEVRLYREFRERFDGLCRRAYEKGVRILVDAEDYCFQDAIDELTDEAMRTFNKKRAIVFATLQMYRRDRMEYLRKIHDDSVKRNYYPGIKFVRGAYMEEERKRAAEMGYPDPICKDKPTTDANFDAGVQFVIDHIDRMELFCGTHNEESNSKLASLIDERGIARNNRRIYFSQLLGMSDNISFNLAHEGFNVTKYVPYARVKDVLPYLIRRAEENTSIAGQTGRELRMLKAEKQRRRQAAGY